MIYWIQKILTLDAMKINISLYLKYYLPNIPKCENIKEDVYSKIDGYVYSGIF